MLRFVAAVCLLVVTPVSAEESQLPFCFDASVMQTLTMKLAEAEENGVREFDASAFKEYCGSTSNYLVSGRARGNFTEVVRHGTVVYGYLQATNTDGVEVFIYAKSIGLKM